MWRKFKRWLWNKYSLNFRSKYVKRNVLNWATIFFFSVCIEIIVYQGAMGSWKFLPFSDVSWSTYDILVLFLTASVWAGHRKRYFLHHVKVFRFTIFKLEVISNLKLEVISNLKLEVIAKIKLEVIVNLKLEVIANRND